MPQQPRRTGRPAKPPEQGKRASLGLKVTGDIKSRLDAAARRNGRTQSQEAEARLEASFNNQDLLPQILDLAYGRQTAGLLMLLGRCIKDASGHAAFAATFSLDAVQAWMSQPWAYQQTDNAIRFVLAALRPPGDPEPPRTNASLAAISEGLRASADNLGEGFAVGILHSVADPDNAALGDEMKHVRARLGPDVIARLTEDDPDAR